MGSPPWASRVLPLGRRATVSDGTLEGEKGRAVDLTPLAVEVIAESFGEWLREEIRLRGELQEPQQLRVSVGATLGGRARGSERRSSRGSPGPATPSSTWGSPPRRRRRCEAPRTWRWVGGGQTEEEEG